MRMVDPEGKTSRLTIQATNDAEAIVIRKFKRILMNHDQTIAEFFMPIISEEVRRREPSNPQTLLDLTHSSGHTLSLAQKEKLRQKGVCSCCGKPLNSPECEGFCSVECAEEYGRKQKNET